MIDLNEQESMIDLNESEVEQVSGGDGENVIGTPLLDGGGCGTQGTC